jgi:hypothetical protein
MCETAIPVSNPERARPRARPGPATQVRPAVADGSLKELKFHWGPAYHLAVVSGVCTARRKDGRGGTLTSPVPAGLRLLIVADYTAMPRTKGSIVKRDRTRQDESCSLTVPPAAATMPPMTVSGPRPIAGCRPRGNRGRSSRAWCAGGRS